MHIKTCNQAPVQHVYTHTHMNPYAIHDNQINKHVINSHTICHYVAKHTDPVYVNNYENARKTPLTPKGNL